MGQRHQGPLAGAQKHAFWALILERSLQEID
jgi:hypothetical protein